MSRFIYLHVGTNKTGTTELQRFFRLNRLHLLEQKVFYPLIYTHRDEQHRLSWSAWDFVNNYTNKFIHLPPPEHYWEHLAQDFQDSKQDILISSEGFYYDFATPEGLTKLEYLKSLFPNHQFKIIVYFREEKAYLKSARNEWIKTGYVFDRICELDEESYYHLLIARGDANYWQWLKNVSEYLGRNNVLVRHYDRDTFVGSDIAADFYHALDLDFPKNPIRLQNDVNPKITKPCLFNIYKSLGIHMQNWPHRSRSKLCLRLNALIGDSSKQTRRNVTGKIEHLANTSQLSDSVYAQTIKENSALRGLVSGWGIESKSAPKKDISIQTVDINDVGQAIAALWKDSQQELIRCYLKIADLSYDQYCANLDTNITTEYYSKLRAKVLEYEEAVLLKKLMSLKLKLQSLDCKSLAFWAYNDHCITLYQNLGTQQNLVCCFIDQRANELPSLGSSVHPNEPAIHTIDNIDLSQLDCIIICSEGSATPMKKILQGRFHGTIIEYNEL